MKWFRALLIISSIGAVCASTIGDDGSLGHRRGGGSDDKGKQSGGGSDVRKQNESNGRSRDRDNQNSGGSSVGSSGGQRDSLGRTRDDNRSNDRIGNSVGGGRDTTDRNRDTGRDRDRIGGGDSNRGGIGNSAGGGRDTTDRNRDRIGGGDINSRDRNDRNEDRVTVGDGSIHRIGSGGNIAGQGSRTQDNDPFSKRKPGSSGTVIYGTANNLRNDPAWSSRPPERDRPPIDVFNPSLTGMVRREDNVVRHTRYRTGYYHYNVGWRDDDFYFGFYYFKPAYDRCVVSPFYYYPFLPPYVSRSRVLVLRVGNVSIYADDSPNYYWDRGIDYRWTRSYWYDSAARRSELDYALDDLVNAWEDSNRRSLNRLVPDRGSIGIYVDERYNYSLNADDFYDMLLDNIQSARTRQYDILSVKTYRNEARVVAVHEYIDPWNRRDRVYHVYRLVNDGYGYQIADFGTSDRRPRR